MEKAIEKLKKEFKEAQNPVKVIINNCLIPELQMNESFGKRILNKKKTTKDMWNFITKSIRTSKNHSPSHDVIFSLAIHYYQEDTPEYVKELTEEEPLEFGKVNKAFNTPIIKKITGTIIKEVVKEVIKEVNKKTPAATIKKKVTKKISKKVDDSNSYQMTLFDENL